MKFTIKGKVSTQKILIIVAIILLACLSGCTSVDRDYMFLNGKVTAQFIYRGDRISNDEIVFTFYEKNNYSINISYIPHNAMTYNTEEDRINEYVYLEIVYVPYTYKYVSETLLSLKLDVKVVKE